MAQDISTSQDNIVALLRTSLDQSFRAILPDHELRRPLTPPLPVTPPTTLVEAYWGRRSGKTRKPTNDQEQCLLLNKLPLELREKIYKEVLGDMNIHLFIFENKIRSVVCPRAPNTTEDDDYYWYTGDEEHKTEDEEEDPYILNHFLRHTKGVRRPRNRCDFCDSNRLRSTYISTVPRLPPTWGIGPNFLPLLLTCRRIYADAIPTLYSHPTFSTNHIYTLTDFLLALPPPRLASLRSLHLVWPVPLNERHYPAASPSSSDSDSFTSSATYASFISPYFASASASAPDLTPPPFGLAPPHDRVTWTAFWTLVATRAPCLRQVAVELVERGWWRRREWEAVIRPVAVVFGGGGKKARARRSGGEEEEDDDDGDDEYGHAVRVEGFVQGDTCIPPLWWE
ncbi:hypothetical protein BFW01_g12551 [Lasiodiplodia theobromae]|nr:hypothetical protein BFW01_g12551 [Lasiodiplodia theobromae]